MNYIYSNVIDEAGYYIGKVVLFEQSEVRNDGSSATEWVVQHYILQDGDSLIDTSKPHARAHAGDEGIVSFRWDGEQWIEGATEEEIAQWEVKNPAPSTATELDEVEAI